MTLCGKSTPGCRSSYRKSITMRGYPVKLGKEVLVPYPADRMKAWPVSSRVNSPKITTLKSSFPIEVESVSRSEDSPQLLLWCHPQTETKADDGGTCGLRERVCNKNRPPCACTIAPWWPEAARVLKAYRWFGVGVWTSGKCSGHKPSLRSLLPAS